ncbi:MAG TPA: branched-chain amino acid ABC transporter substrate-binding protein [Solirubrobacteraceae bacterium]|nr:branched-chain amino acid ABC transporter substrate-binding protein [Solirubrobacteraceae bacterium]
MSSFSAGLTTMTAIIDIAAQTGRNLSARLAGAGLLAAAAVGIGACGSTHTALSGPAVSGNTLTIYSSLPLQGATSGQAEGIVNGAKLALQDAGSRIGNYTIKYMSLDDSSAATGATSNAVVARNAGRAVGDATAIAYIGEFNSGATEVSLPILNRAGIAQISPSNTYVGLTTNNPGSLPGEPEKFYPTGKRTFARIVPADDVQGAALAIAAKQADCKNVEIWNSGTPYSAGLARNLELAAGKTVATLPGPVGQRAPAPAHALHIAANVRVSPTASSYAAQARGITASCFVFTGELESGAAQIYKDVAAAHPAITMFGGDATVANAIASPTTGLPASIAGQWQGTFPTLAPTTLGAGGKKFVEEYDHAYNTTNPDPYAIYGYEAMALALSTIKSVADAHNGQVSRADVVNALLHTQNRHSVIGTYSINANGDTTLAAYGLYRISSGRLAFGKALDTRKL